MAMLAAIMAASAVTRSGSSRSPSHDWRVLTIGECLWDGLPSGCFLGGAPLNVAAHLAARGAKAKFAAAVGDDRLGKDALRRLNLLGVDTSCVQVVAELETGFVTAELDHAGCATYTFVTPAAWDALAADDPTLLAAAAETDALVFGSLSQRDPRTRAAVKQAVGIARAAGALVAYDVNLRPPHTPPHLIAESCGYGVDLLKLNDAEVEQVARAVGCDAGVRYALEAAAAAGRPEAGEAFVCAAGAIADAVGAQAVVITRGAEGAVMSECLGGDVHECAGYIAPQVRPANLH
jgi:fructokinase